VFQHNFCNTELDHAVKVNDTDAILTLPRQEKNTVSKICVNTCFCYRTRCCAWCSIGQISEEVAQEALLELVSTTRCYGTSAAREMDIYRIIPSCALHVRSQL